MNTPNPTAEQAIFKALYPEATHNQVLASKYTERILMDLRAHGLLSDGNPSNEQIELAQAKDDLKTVSEVSRATFDRLKAERDAALSTVAKVRELHQPAWDSVSAMYPTPLCGCGEEYRECPTVQVLPPSLAINAGGLNPEGMTP